VQKSDTSGKAGGLTFTGPSKGPKRKRKKIKTKPLATMSSPSAFIGDPDFERLLDYRFPLRNAAGMTGYMSFAIILPELSNSRSPPAKPGVYLEEIIRTVSLPLVFLTV
jgi:hypothetical protein